MANSVIEFLGEEDGARPVIYKLVHHIGVARTQELVLATVAHYGFFTTPEWGLNSPGGVFLKLARKGSYLSKEERKAVFKKPKRVAVN